MKKTVIFEFSDDFQFTEKWDRKKCAECPFDISMDDEPLCLLTGDSEHGPAMYDKGKGRIVHLPHPQCPFYGGAETVSCDGC